MKIPADLYMPSLHPYHGLPEIDNRNALVTNCGRICMHCKKINISTVMAGQKLGLKEVTDARLEAAKCRSRPAVLGRRRQLGSASAYRS